MHDQFVVFKQGESFVCNGVSLPLTNTTAYQSSTIPNAGTVENCVYTSPQGQATLSVTVPAIPQIVTPRSGETVTRSTQTPVVVAPTPGCQGMELEISSPNTIGGLNGYPLPWSGCATHQDVDTTGATAGNGFMQLEEADTSAPITNNAGFHSLTINAYAYTEMPITWK